MVLGALSYLAVPLCVAGGTIVVRCFREFVTKGHGTPAPIDPQKELVVTGFYRFVRNPMYDGVLLVLFGHILWFTTLGLVVYAAFFFVAAHLFVA